jgi:hypothetical protein
MSDEDDNPYASPQTPSPPWRANKRATDAIARHVKLAEAALYAIGSACFATLAVIQTELYFETLYLGASHALKTARQ